jgi:hypothetical protein
MTISVKRFVAEVKEHDVLAWSMNSSDIPVFAALFHDLKVNP